MNKKYELTIQSKSGTFLQRHIVSRQTAQTVCDFVKYNGYGNYADVKLIVASAATDIDEAFDMALEECTRNTRSYSRLLFGRVSCVNIHHSKDTLTMTDSEKAMVDEMSELIKDQNKKICDQYAYIQELSQMGDMRDRVRLLMYPVGTEVGTKNTSEW